MSSQRPLLLLVEDEPTIVTALARLLDRWGFDTVPARTAAEAATVLAGTTVDLVVIDYRLPDERGDQLHARLAQDHPQLARRTLFITGDFAEPALVAIEATGCPYLLKPFELGIFVHELRALLDTSAPPETDARADAARRSDASAA